MKQISYIFPVYNEAESLKELYKVIASVISKVEDKYEVELIFVNDGSSDESLSILSEIAQNDERVILINFSRNFGHQMAITAGLDFASGDAVIIMDSDLQDPPEVSLDLIKKWEEGFEIVYAQRRARKDSLFKKLTAFIFYRLLFSLSSIKIPKDTGDFRLMDRKVVDEIKKFKETNRFMRGLTSYVGFKQTAVPFDRNERFAGKTHYPITKMISFALDGITSFSTVPLKLITQFGFFVSFLSFLGIAYALVVRFFFPELTVTGTTFAIIAVLFMGGVQMITLGIIGEYIGRIYTEVQNRPLYIVKSVIGRPR